MLIATALSEERHPSKWATRKFREKSKKARIQLLVAQSQLQSLLNDCDDNTVEGAKRIHDLQKKIRGLEKDLTTHPGRI
jgi:hypothetical protein